jgi:hypothetical protein
LRKKCTVLIKGTPTVDPTPFDLLTDRYLPYDIDTPAKSIDALARTIAASLASDRMTDSPIFQMIPSLAEADPERVAAVPPDLMEEVRRAASFKAKGWLRLLADDVRGQRFERSGLRLIAKAQWDVGDYESARDNWEIVRELNPDGVASNLALANIYERMSRENPDTAEKRADLLMYSEQAIERVLHADSATGNEIAEALALKGRNRKTQWRHGYEHLMTLVERRAAAISSALRESYESYRAAFERDLNHFYPGLGALQMGSILLDLADDEGWGDIFSDDDAANTYKADLEQGLTELKSAVRFSVQAALQRDATDHWARISAADLLFLTDERDRRVLKAYEDVFGESPYFDWDSAKGQLEIYARLGVREQRARLIIDSIEAKMDKPQKRPRHIILFAGHQVDDATRTQPRFPPAKEAQARSLIAAAMKELLTDADELTGLSSAWPGADLIWHEVCKELGAATTVCLPIPVKDHARVVFKGSDGWRSRFLDLIDDKKRRVLTLSDREGLPRWLEGKGIDPWARGNEWVIKMALSSGAAKLTLLALWDGVENAGGAGTAHMVELARQAGNVRIKIIDSRQLLG